MRIATHSIYDQGVYHMAGRTAQVHKLQNQIASGNRVVTPSEDPVAAARSLDLTQSSEINKQYGTNSDSATSSLAFSEANLQQIVQVIQRIHTQTVQAGDGALGVNDKTILAHAIRSNYQELLGLVNTTDGNGQYLYSGYKGTTRPFRELSFGNVVYEGDQGQRLVQISPSRQIPVSDSGSALFVNIKDGNETYTAVPAKPDYPRSITVGDGSPIQMNFEIDADSGQVVGMGDKERFLPSYFRVNWHADEQVYTITRLLDGESVGFTQQELESEAGVNAFGFTLSASPGSQVPRKEGSMQFDATLAYNQGTGLISPGDVTNPLKWNSVHNMHNFRVLFHVVDDPGRPGQKLSKYDLIDDNPTSQTYNRSLIDGWDYTTASGPEGTTRSDSEENPNAFPRLYGSNSDIVLAQQTGEYSPLIPAWDFGTKFWVENQPADGDAFKIRPSRTRDVFTTVGDIVKALDSHPTNDADEALFHNTISQTLQALENSITNIVTLQAGLGSRQNENDSVKETNSTLNRVLKQSISEMTDLDYAKAISDYNQSQTLLNAAQQSFAQSSRLSLFNYL